MTCVDGGLATCWTRSIAQFEVRDDVADRASLSRSLFLVAICVVSSWINMWTSNTLGIILPL